MCFYVSVTVSVKLPRLLRGQPRSGLASTVPLQSSGVFSCKTNVWPIMVNLTFVIRRLLFFLLRFVAGEANSQSVTATNRCGVQKSSSQKKRRRIKSNFI